MDDCIFIISEGKSQCACQNPAIHMSHIEETQQHLDTGPGRFGVNRFG